MDLLEIDAASYTGVDNIRDIIDHVKFSPSIGKYKVFIIDEVHMLSKAAFNALLKTLEEPPAHAIFVLATTEIHKVPATIISRAQRFDFKRVSIASILELFKAVLRDEKLKIAPPAQQLIAQAAEGSFRDALSILDQLISSGGKQVTVSEVEELLGLVRIESSQKFLDLLAGADVKAAAKFVKDLAFEGRDLVQFTRSFLEYLQLVLYVKMQIEEIGGRGLLADEEAKLKKQSESLTGAKLLAIIKGILEAYRAIKLSPVPELPLLAQILALADTSSAAAMPVAPSVAKLNPAAEAPRPADHARFAEAQARPRGLDLGTVLDRWAEVLSKVKEYNHSLLSSLRLGRVVELQGGELVLAFPYNFHKETIEARKNRIVVERVLEEVLEQPLKIKVYLERELTEAKNSQAGGSDLVGEALKVLGEE